MKIHLKEGQEVEDINGNVYIVEKNDLLEASLTMGSVKKELQALGITLTKSEDDEFVVNFSKGKEATAYYTDDLEDALMTGKSMAKEKK